MDSNSAEKALALIYPLIIFLAFICSVCSAIVWNHWKYVLDTCVETNCGCFLNGLSTPTFFTGGHVLYCHWMVYGLLFPLFCCLILGSFHLFRVCMNKGGRRTETTTVRQKAGDVIVMSSRTELTDDHVSPYYWVPSSVLAVFFTIYTIVHASMFTDGLLRTCRQYRQELVKYLHASGNLVGALQGRISCPAVFDFMDYLHPDVNFYRRRDTQINTAAAIIIALLSAWACVILWCYATVINIIQSRNSRRVRV